MIHDEDDDECTAITGLVARENRSTQRKPNSVPHYPSEIPYDFPGFELRLPR